MTFLGKLKDEWDELEKFIFVPLINEGSENEDDKTVPENSNINNDCNLVNHDFDCKAEEENLFGQDIKGKLKVTSKTTSNLTVLIEMKICEHFTMRILTRLLSKQNMRRTGEILNFLIDIATTAMVAEDKKVIQEKPKKFTKA